MEFRRCSETGQFYLLEINPRFWGSVALSEAAGINFPALYYHCARGEEVETPTYREGVRLRLMPTYLASGLMSLRRGPRGMAKAISDLRYLFDPRVREGLLTLDDPGGSLAYIRKNLLRGGREDG
ncbi:MAG: ATP-grasp domain-containing protein [Armatimonadota bacterium]